MSDWSTPYIYGLYIKTTHVYTVFHCKRCINAYKFSYETKFHKQKKTGLQLQNKSLKSAYAKRALVLMKRFSNSFLACGWLMHITSGNRITCATHKSPWTKKFKNCKVKMDEWSIKKVVKKSWLTLLFELSLELHYFDGFIIEKNIIGSTKATIHRMRIYFRCNNANISL